MSHKKKMVTAVFRNQLDAERAFDSLREMGYMGEEINVLFAEKTRADWYTRGNNSHLMTGLSACSDEKSGAIKWRTVET